MNRVVVIAVSQLMMLISVSCLASASKGFVTLLGESEGFIEAELCFEEKIDLTLSTDYLSATNNLKKFISGLKNNIPIKQYVNKEPNNFQLGVPRQFYTEQVNIKFKHALFWDGYVGLGAQYFYSNNRNIHWREDFFCTNGYQECKIDFDFSNDQNNQLFESIYYHIVNGKNNIKSSAMKALDEVFKVRYKAPYNEGENNKALSCPLYLNYNLVKLGAEICLNCNDKKIEIKGDKNILFKRMIDNILAEIQKIRLISPEQIIKQGVTATKIVGINNKESGIGMESFINYLSSWENIRLLGYIKNNDQYYIFVEYNFKEKEHGKLEVLRFKKIKSSYQINLKVDADMSENILYSTLFLNSVRKMYMPKVELNK